jgi:hypothetical protein
MPLPFGTGWSQSHGDLADNHRWAENARDVQLQELHQL